MRALALFVCLFLAAPAAAVAAPAAGGGGRFVKRVLLPGGGAVVVAEGDMEPKGAGSYSVRLYRDARAGRPAEGFEEGLVRRRGGPLERVALADLLGDGGTEVVVIMRGAGDSDSLSADAYSVEDGRLTLVASAESLDPGADPLRALREELGR